MKIEKRYLDLCNNLFSSNKEIANQTLNILKMEKLFGNDYVITGVRNALKVTRPQLYKRLNL